MLGPLEVSEKGRKGALNVILTRGSHRLWSQGAITPRLGAHNGQGQTQAVEAIKVPVDRLTGVAVGKVALFHRETFNFGNIVDLEQTALNLASHA